MKKKIKIIFFAIPLIISFFMFSKQSFAISIIRDAYSESVLQSILNRLLVASDIPENRIKILLVNDDSYNAFVIDQNYIFINVGLINLLQNPEQVSAVLAHELGHIVLGHALLWQHAANNNAIRSLLFILLGTAMTIFSDEYDNAGFVAISGAMAYYKQSMTRFTREQETQADTFAVNILTKANLPVAELINTFALMYNRGSDFSQEYPEFLFDHPITKKRINAIHTLNHQKTYIPFSENIKYSFFSARYLLKAFRVKIQDSKKLIESIPNQWKEQAKAIIYYRKGNIKTSLLSLKKSLKEQDNVYLYYIASQIAYRGGYLKSSYSAAYKAYKLAPNNPIICANMADILLKINNKKNYKQIKTILEQVLLKEPYMKQVWHSYAMLSAKMKNDGVANYAMAMEASLDNRKKDALLLAKKAQKKLKPHSQYWLKAQDIINSFTY